MSRTTPPARRQTDVSADRVRHLFDNDRTNLIVFHRTSKKRLYEELDPVTNKRVIPGKSENNTYTAINVPGSKFRPRLHEEVDWTFRFAARFKLGGLAAIAVGLKCGFEFWYATTLRQNGRWKEGQSLMEALLDPDHRATSEDVAQFAGSAHYRDVVCPGILAGLREHLAFSSHPRHVPVFSELDANTLPKYLTAGLDANWPLLPIFENDEVRDHLADPQPAVLAPKPDQVEWKCVILKERAALLVNAVMRAVLRCTTEPFGWHDVGALAENLAFFKGGDKDGTTVEPSPSAGRRLSKNDCVLVQHSVVVIADTPQGRYVPGIARRSLTADKKPRISAGSSFLVSVTCPPDASLRRVEQAIWDTLHAKLFQDARTAGTLQPRGILLNTMSSKAIPDLRDAKARDKFTDASERPYKENPVYLMLVWTCQVEGKPTLKAATANNPFLHADTIDEFWLPLRDLTLLDLDLYGERALLHALLHPDSSPITGNGGAWFIDHIHPANADWKLAFARPRQGSSSGDGAVPRASL